MRIAIISDIHGNDFAFEKVEADIKRSGVGQIACLGDAIQGGAQPAAVVGRLRRLDCPVVTGNADAWMLSGIETADEGISPERKKKMEEIRQWSLVLLFQSGERWIRLCSLPARRTIPRRCVGGVRDLDCRVWSK
jgi:predicted phosphodiesterase